MKTVIAFAAAALLTTAAHAGCYTVLDSKGNIISETSTPPVDMEYQLHQTVPYRYGKGARMIFSVAEDDCGPEVDLHDTSWRTDRARAAAKKTKRKAAAASAAPAAEAAEPAAPAVVQ